jgi:hypothetical protein
MSDEERKKMVQAYAQTIYAEIMNRHALGAYALYEFEKDADERLRNYCRTAKKVGRIAAEVLFEDKNNIPDPDYGF